MKVKKLCLTTRKDDPASLQTIPVKANEALRREHPHLKLVIIQDELSDSGPNILLLESLKMKYIVVSTRPVFDWIDKSKISYYEYKDTAGYHHKYRFVNHIAFNGVHQDLKTNFFDYEEISP